MSTPSPPISSSSSSCSSPPSSSCASCSPPSSSPSPPPCSGYIKQVQETILPIPNTASEVQQDAQKIFVAPIGFRYNPTDQEVIINLLANKVLGEKLPHDIKEINPYEYDPCDHLPPSHNDGRRHYYYYYFVTTHPRSLEATYTIRTTPNGYWKPTTGDVAIFQSQQIIGFRKSLVFYRGKAPTGEKTHWFMREYRLNPKPFRVKAYGNSCLAEMERCLLCRIQHYTEGSDSDQSGFGS